MIVFPNAKINLGLQVTEKLPNGYHAINTCFYPVPWCDLLEIVPAQKTTFDTSGIKIPGNPKENLCVKAYQLLKKDFQLPEVSIYLHKLIPMGAGLGGGSADAAFMLKLISEEFKLFLDDPVLEMYAAQLGSDCPFFIQNNPSFATGTGTDLSPISLNLKGCHLLLVYPNLHISTQEAYAGILPSPAKVDLKKLVVSKDFSNWKEALTNDFETSVFPKYPLLESIKDQLYKMGALYASMSGSGATMFGLFTSQHEIDPTPFKNFQWKLIKL